MTDELTNRWKTYAFLKLLSQLKVTFMFDFWMLCKKKFSFMFESSVTFLYFKWDTKFWFKYKWVSFVLSPMGSKYKSGEIWQKFMRLNTLEYRWRFILGVEKRYLLGNKIQIFLQLHRNYFEQKINVKRTRQKSYCN